MAWQCVGNPDSAATGIANATHFDLLTGYVIAFDCRLQLPFLCSCALCSDFELKAGCMFVACWAW